MTPNGALLSCKGQHLTQATRKGDRPPNLKPNLKPTQPAQPPDNTQVPTASNRLENPSSPIVQPLQMCQSRYTRGVVLWQSRRARAPHVTLPPRPYNIDSPRRRRRVAGIYRPLHSAGVALNAAHPAQKALLRRCAVRGIYRRHWRCVTCSPRLPTHSEVCLSDFWPAGFILRGQIANACTPYGARRWCGCCAAVSLCLRGCGFVIGIDWSRIASWARVR